MPDMHILILINSLTSGGAERVTVNLSSYLVEKGYKATVVTIKNEERDFYTLDRRVARICLDSTQRTLRSNRVMANLKQRMKRLTVLRILGRLSSLRILGRLFSLRILGRLFSLRVLDRLSLFRTLKSLKPLRKVIKQQQPDIVLGMITSNAVRAIIASFGLPTKVITSERNFPGRKKTSSRWARFRKRFYRFADGHVVQTHKISCWLKKHTRASNITIIPNSVTYPIISLSPVLAPQMVVSKESKVILAVGKLHEQKGFDLLISAFHRIAQHMPGWVLVILGKDVRTEGQRQSLQQQIDELDLNDKVKMPGCAGNISDWYRRSDIFVLSSRYEGFPNVLLEAMANGCSCISSDCDTGPSEIIINEQNGLLIPSEDIDSLAEAMERLVKDEKLRAHIAANAIKVRENFSEHRIMSMWIKFFEEVLRSDSGILKNIIGSGKAMYKRR
ncbi:MAG: glycosyltransferase family 4 protein [Sedimentisphaerales bacterium]